MARSAGARARRGGADRLILRANASDERVGLLQIDTADIHVAEYLTKLPLKPALQRRLHQAVAEVRVRIVRENLD